MEEGREWAMPDTFGKGSSRRPHSPKHGGAGWAKLEEGADSWRGVGRRMRSRYRWCNREPGRRGERGGGGRRRRDSERKVGVGGWGSGLGREQGAKPDAVFGQRAEWLRRQEDNTDAVGAGGHFRTHGRGSARRGERGGEEELRAPGRAGELEPAAQVPREEAGRERRGGGISGVPPHGAAGGLLPQMRGRGSPAQLEVLEGAEPIMEQPWSGQPMPRHSPYLTTPCPPPPRRCSSRHRGARRSFSHAGGGETKPEAVSALGSRRPEHCACADNP